METKIQKAVSFTFKNAAYSFVATEAKGEAIIKSIAENSPKYHTLAKDDPVKVDLKAGVAQYIGEQYKDRVEAYMVYNKDSKSYIAVDKAQYDKAKGDKYHRTVGYILSTIEKPSLFATMKDEAKKASLEKNEAGVRFDIRKAINLKFNRLEKAVKAITDPKAKGEGTPTAVFQQWLADELKGMEKRRANSESRDDVVPPKAWFEAEIIKPMSEKLKAWYADNAK